MTISSALAPVASDLAAVESRLLAMVEHDGEPGLTVRPLLAAGGKRLRPALLLLSAALGPRYDFELVRAAAVAVELIHLATLVHDDLIDRSPTRRGVEALWAKNGDAAAIVVADFYFSRAYQEAARTGRPQVVAEMADVVMRMCEGELEQQRSRWLYHLDMPAYLRRLELKTGLLLALCCRLGAFLGEVDEQGEAALAAYGLSLGIAFQIADDVLDYLGSPEVIGKPVAHDLREGHVTLPVMLAMQDPDAGRELEELLHDGAPVDDASVSRVVELIRTTGSAERALEQAKGHSLQARRSLGSLPDRPERRSLEELADYVVERSG